MAGEIGRIKSPYRSWHFDWLTQSTGKRKVSVPLGPSLGPVNRILSSRKFIVPEGKRYYASPASTVVPFRHSYFFSSLYCLSNQCSNGNLTCIHMHMCVCAISRCLYYFMDTEIHEYNFDVHSLDSTFHFQSCHPSLIILHLHFEFLS